MKVGIIIQARMGSSRLSGKVLKDICGKSVLQHVIERVKQIPLMDEIIIATTVEKQDDAIEKECKKLGNLGVKYFRGSEDDVLSRYYFAAKENNIDVVVRITSDCPLIDPYVTNEVIKSFINNEYDIVTNAGINMETRTYPRGLDTEVFSFKYLEEAYNNAKEKYEREHVTPYLYENAKDAFYYVNDINYSKYRWTLDTDEDFELISIIYEKLYKGEHNFYLDDILKVFVEDESLININAHIEQKKIK